jgi:hypothetical protein
VTCTYNMLSGAGTAIPFRSTWVHPCFLCVHVAQSLVFYVAFCRSLFVLFLLPIVLYVLLWFTASD